MTSLLLPSCLSFANAFHRLSFPLDPPLLSPALISAQYYPLSPALLGSMDEHRMNVNSTAYDNKKNGESRVDFPFTHTQLSSPSLL